jgi:hypothetical protein
MVAYVLTFPQRFSVWYVDGGRSNGPGYSILDCRLLGGQPRPGHGVVYHSGIYRKFLLRAFTGIDTNPLAGAHARGRFGDCHVLPQPDRHGVGPTDCRLAQ